MALRVWLVVLIVASTAAFVVGTSLERRDSGHSDSATPVSSIGGGQAGGGEAGGGEAGGGEAGGGESAAHRAAEGGGVGTAGETHSELKPLGVDIEAVPFVVLAALISLGLAAAAWLRPRSRPLLIAVAIVMLGFGVLDVREVFHQSDESNAGLAVLAGVVAALHLAAGTVAALMAASGADHEATGGALGAPG